MRYLSCPIRWYLSKVQVSRRRLSYQYVFIWDLIDMYRSDHVLVMGQCTHSFHMVRKHTHAVRRIILTSTKHCLDTWINQESSQGRCPMCRQGQYISAELPLTSKASQADSRQSSVSKALSTRAKFKPSRHQLLDPRMTLGKVADHFPSIVGNSNDAHLHMHFAKHGLVRVYCQD